MKSLLSILLFFGAVSFYTNAQNQEQTKDKLIQVLVGKWKIVKYQSKNRSPLKPTIVEFQSDGTFKNDGTYFATKEGSFRTDENRHILILENGAQITEWKTTLKKGVLQLDLIPKNNETSARMTLLRVKEG